MKYIVETCVHAEYMSVEACVINLFSLIAVTLFFNLNPALGPSTPACADEVAFLGGGPFWGYGPVFSSFFHTLMIFVDWFYVLARVACCFFFVFSWINIKFKQKINFFYYFSIFIKH